MPRRKFSKRRFRFRRRPRRNFKRLRRTIKSTIRSFAEKKQLVSNSVDTNTEATTSVYQFFDSIAPGTGNGSRIGTTIQSQRIGFGLTIRYNFETSSNQGAAVCRVIVLFPRKGVSPSTNWISTIQANISAVTGYVPHYLAKVLYDRKVHVGYSGSSTAVTGNAPQSTVFLKWYKRYFGKVNYDQDATVGREPYLFLLNNVGALSNSTVRFDLTRRVTYVDV